MTIEIDMYYSLRGANIARQKLWDDGQVFTGEYFGNALAGEVGETCNVVKKIARERMGRPGSRATMEQLADEIADVIIYADLLALHYDIDLQDAVASKFNKTSIKMGFSTRLSRPPMAR